MMQKLYSLGDGFYIEELAQGYALVKLCVTKTRILSRNETAKEALDHYLTLIRANSIFAEDGDDQTA